MPFLVFPPGVSTPVSVNVSGVHADSYSGGKGATLNVFGSGQTATVFTAAKGSAGTTSFAGVEVDANTGGMTAGPVVLVSASSVQTIGYVADRGLISAGLASVHADSNPGGKTAQVIAGVTAASANASAGAIGGTGPSLPSHGVSVTGNVGTATLTIGGTTTVFISAVRVNASLVQLIEADNDGSAPETSIVPGGTFLTGSLGITSVIGTGSPGGFTAPITKDLSGAEGGSNVGSLSTPISVDIPSVPATATAASQARPFSIDLTAIEVIGALGNLSLGGAIGLDAPGVLADGVVGTFSLQTTYDLAAVETDATPGIGLAGAIGSGVSAIGETGGFSVSYANTFGAVEADATTGSEIVELSTITSGVQAQGIPGTGTVNFGRDAVGVGANANVGGQSIAVFLATAAIKTEAIAGISNTTLGGALDVFVAAAFADGISGTALNDFPGSVDMSAVEVDAYPGAGLVPSQILTVFPDPFLATSTVDHADPFSAISVTSHPDPFLATAATKR